MSGRIPCATQCFYSNSRQVFRTWRFPVSRERDTGFLSSFSTNRGHFYVSRTSNVSEQQEKLTPRLVDVPQHLTYLLMGKKNKGKKVPLFNKYWTAIETEGNLHNGENNHGTSSWMKLIWSAHISASHVQGLQKTEDVFPDRGTINTGLELDQDLDRVLEELEMILWRGITFSGTNFRFSNSNTHTHTHHVLHLCVCTGDLHT